MANDRALISNIGAGNSKIPARRPNPPAKDPNVLPKRPNSLAARRNDPHLIPKFRPRNLTARDQMYPSPHPKYPLSASKIELSGKNAGFWVSEAEISIFPLKMSGFAVKSPTSDLEYRASDLGACQSDHVFSTTVGRGGIAEWRIWIS